MTEQEIVQAFKEIYEYKKEIEKIQEDRKSEEAALAVEYKVDECNQKRTTIALNYQHLINEKMAQIKVIEGALGTKTV